MVLCLVVVCKKARFQDNTFVVRNCVNHNITAVPDGLLHDSFCGCSPVGLATTDCLLSLVGAFVQPIKLMQWEIVYAQIPPVPAVPLVFELRFGPTDLTWQSDL